MSTETELKLSFPRQQVKLLLDHPLWETCCRGTTEHFRLGNTYFDTPDQGLNRARMALRIREIREKERLFFQTLKTGGNSINGLTHRNEWEWPVPDARLDLSLIRALNLDQLQDVPLKDLNPLFSTDFQRTCQNLTWCSPFAHIEAAIDIGYVICNERKSPICELELELKDGDQAALMQVAEQLSGTIDLAFADSSKAQRGFALLMDDIKTE